MPIAFIFIAVLILFLVFYRNIKLLTMPRILLVTILLLLLIGYFIDAITVNDMFSVNIIFMFVILFLGFEFYLSINNKLKIVVPCIILLNILTYFIITSLNSDYLSFLNYMPIFMIITLSSIIAIHNFNAGFSVILFSFLFVEIINYFIFRNNIGILEIGSYEFLNYLLYALVINFTLNRIYWFVRKNLFRNSPKRVVEHEN